MEYLNIIEEALGGYDSTTEDCIDMIEDIEQFVVYLRKDGAAAELIEYLEHKMESAVEKVIDKGICPNCGSTELVHDDYRQIVRCDTCGYKHKE